MRGWAEWATGVGGGGKEEEEVWGGRTYRFRRGEVSGEAGGG